MNDTALQSILAGMKEIEKLRQICSDYLSEEKISEAECKARDIDRAVWDLVDMLEETPTDWGD